jgi:hypothetical protein
MATYQLMQYLRANGMDRIPLPGCLSPWDVQGLEETNPGTTFYHLDTAIPPDTRTRLQKVYKSPPKPELVWKSVGRYIPTNNLILTFNHNGTIVEFEHGDNYSTCGYFKVEKLAPRTSVRRPRFSSMDPRINNRSSSPPRPEPPPAPECPLEDPKCITLNKMSDLLKTNPGTTYYHWEVPPDTRTIAQTLYKSQPTEKDWVFVGELVSIDVGPEGPQREPGHSVTYTFNNNGTRIDRNSHIYTGDEVSLFKLAKLGSPRPTAPPAEGGRKRSSRVKKQTRRAQRKRRNTIRK